ncbi:MAG: ABC transporter permease [Endomicrobium sp.]|jgi:lipoprotein-releasing system permease protein|nr:ABC transporter permease [Endomicrobium sp.]
MNFFSVDLFIALRYLNPLKLKNKNFFELFSVFFAVGGVTFGIATIIVTLSIINGFQNDIKNRILGMQSHIVITKNNVELFDDYLFIEKILRANKSVLSISPFICKQGVIINNTRKAYFGSIIIKGINYEKENNVLNFSKKIVTFDKKFNWKNIPDKTIILGSELAKNISINVGDEVVFMFCDNSIYRTYKFKVLAIMQSGVYDFDSSFGFIDLSKSQFFLSTPNTVVGFGVRVNNLYEVNKVALQLKKTIPNSYVIKTWIELNKNLFAALKLEKIMVFLIFGLIIFIVTFNIISNLLLFNVQKSREIGIMSAIGFSRFLISKIFFYEGLMIGLIGVIFGTIIGLFISFLLKFFDFFKLPQDIYYVNKLPILIIPYDVIITVLSAFIVIVTAGIYPSYCISKLNPLEIIKHG